MADTSDKTLPKIVPLGIGSSITGASDKNTPKITTSGVGLSSNVNSVKDIPRITVSSVGASSAGVSDKTLPKITASSMGDSSSASSDENIPRITAVGVGMTSEVGVSSEIIPMRTAVGAARTNSIGISSEPVPMRLASGTAKVSSVAASSAVLPNIEASGVARTGTVGASSVVLDLIVAFSFGYQNDSNTVITPENPYNDPQEAWAINAETNAPYRYYRFPANAMCRFKGKTFVSNAAGIYEVTGTTDAGQKIDSQVTLPRTDFSETRNKNIPEVYVGIRSTGRMQLKVVANSDSGRYYALNTGPDYMRGSRATLGRGLQARYWQLAVANIDGAEFTLDGLEFKPTLLNRRGV